MDNFKITKTILENINEQNDRINECVDIVNGYTTDEETRVNQEIQRQENELRREEQYNNNESRFVEINQQLETVNTQLEHITKVLTDYQDLVVNNDWSKAMEKAIDDVKDGGRLLIPKGVFEMSAHLNFEVDWTTREMNRHFTIEGTGTGSVIKVKNGTNYGLFINHPVSLKLINNSTGYKYRLEQGVVKLKNFAVDCNNNHTGIRISSSLGIQVEGLNIYNIKSHLVDENTGGLYIDGAGGFIFRDITSRADDDTAINININTGSGDGSLSNCHLTGGAYNVLYKDCTGNHRIFNNLFQYGNINICTKGDSNDNAKFNIFNNFFETNKGHSIHCNVDSVKAFLDCFINNNVIWLHGQNSANGIELGRCERVTISDNRFMEIKGAITGTCIKTKGNYHIIKDNVINNLGENGVGIDVGSDNTKVKGNDILNGVENSTFIKLNNVGVCKVIENKTFGDFKGKGLSVYENLSFTNYNNELKNADTSPNAFANDNKNIKTLTDNVENLQANFNTCFRPLDILRASDGDFNNATSLGVYYSQGASLNVPSGVNKYGLLQVLRRSEYIVQMYFPNDTKQFRRYSANSGTTWSAWLEF